MSGDQRPTTGWLALLVAVVFGVWIVASRVPDRQLAPDEELVAERIELGKPSLMLDVWVDPAAPCAPNRYDSALQRWAEAGWPRASIIAYPDSDTLHVVEASLLETIEDAAQIRGAVGTYCVTDRGCVYILATRKSACRYDDYTIEHEFGHGVYSLGHTNWPAGWVMNTPHSRVGKRIPGPAEEEQ